MNEDAAVICFAALSHALRLKMIRLLTKAAPEGLTAGDLAEQTGLSPSNVTFHASKLEQAGLVTSTRRSRNVIYQAEIAKMNALLRYVTDDCCEGHPEICSFLDSKETTAA